MRITTVEERMNHPKQSNRVRVVALNLLFNALICFLLVTMMVGGVLSAHNNLNEINSPKVMMIEKDETFQQQPGTNPIILSPSGQIVAGSANDGSPNLYSISIPSSSYLTVSFTSISSYVSIYVKETTIPTQYDYDYSILSQYSTQNIYPKSFNSTSTIFIAVYGLYNYNDYVLTVGVSSNTIPNWMIGVIVGSVISGIVVLLIAFIVPVLICMGVCCFAAHSHQSSTHTYTPITTTTTTIDGPPTNSTLHSPTVLSTPQTPVYYQQEDTSYYNPNVGVVQPQYYYQPQQYSTYQKIQ